jgi:ABC-2 type transport system ATP-binding protein
MSRFDLEAAGDQPVRSYSGGMRRRLDLAASMMVQRPVLVLDEPTTGLDPRSRQKVWEIVRELRSSGVTVLLTTQYLEEVDKLGDHIVVIDQGRVIASGTPDELKGRIGGSVCEVRIEDDADRAAAFAALAAAMDGVAGTDEMITIPVGATRMLTEVVRVLDDAGLEPDSIVVRQPSLDDVFLALTDDPKPSDGHQGASDNAVPQAQQSGTRGST